MRVEPPPFVFRTTDRRRAGSSDRRGPTRAGGREQPDRRARCVARPWLDSAFAAHLLGQMLVDQPTAEAADRAYRGNVRGWLRSRNVRYV